MKTPKRIRNHVNPFSYKKDSSFIGFDNKNPIMVDIGSYRGEFGEKLLEKFKDSKNLILFEIRKPFFKYLKKIFEKENNVKIFDGDAGYSIKNILKNSIKNGIDIEKIFVNFPDPWFKEKHKKRRVVNVDFLKNLQKWIPKNTEIIFQTDQEILFLETKELIEENGNFEINIFEKPLWEIKSYWEEMKAKEGNKIYRMSFQIK